MMLYTAATYLSTHLCMGRLTPHPTPRTTLSPTVCARSLCSQPRHVITSSELPLGSSNKIASPSFPQWFLHKVFGPNELHAIDVDDEEVLIILVPMSTWPIVDYLYESCFEASLVAIPLRESTRVLVAVLCIFHLEDTTSHLVHFGNPQILSKYSVGWCAVHVGLRVTWHASYRITVP